MRDRPCEVCGQRPAAEGRSGLCLPCWEEYDREMSAWLSWAEAHIEELERAYGCRSSDWTEVYQ